MNDALMSWLLELFGFIAAAVLALATGKRRSLHPLAYLFAILFVVRYALK